MPRKDNGDPFSIRRSVIVWLAGGVFGWVIAVVLIYGTIRVTSHGNIAEDQRQGSPAITQEETLQDIAPGAGTRPDGDEQSEN